MLSHSHPVIRLITVGTILVALGLASCSTPCRVGSIQKNRFFGRWDGKYEDGKATIVILSDGVWLLLLRGENNEIVSRGGTYVSTDSGLRLKCPEGSILSKSRPTYGKAKLNRSDDNILILDGWPLRRTREVGGVKSENF